MQHTVPKSSWMMPRWCVYVSSPAFSRIFLMLTLVNLAAPMSGLFAHAQAIRRGNICSRATCSGICLSDVVFCISQKCRPVEFGTPAGARTCAWRSRQGPLLQAEIQVPFSNRSAGPRQNAGGRLSLPQSWLCRWCEISDLFLRSRCCISYTCTTTGTY